MTGMAGERIVLTRSAEDIPAWAERVAAAGGEPVAFPCIDTELVAGSGTAAALAAALAAADWLVFTSRRGVDAYAALGAPPLGPGTRVATVGRATAERARAACGRADLVGRGTGVALARTLAAEPGFGPGVRCVIAVAANAGPELAAILTAAGAECRRFDLYRTLPAAPASPRTPWSSLDARKVVFASPTAVTGFLNRVEMDAACEIYTIGPSTSAAVREHGLAVTAEAAEPGIEGILESILESAHA